MEGATLLRRPLLRKLIGNTSWQVADKILRMGVGLLVGVWVARYLGPGDFGLLNFAIAFTALFSPLADLGLQAVVVRDLVRVPQQRPQIIASAIVLRLMGAAAAIAVCCVSLVLLRSGDRQSLFMALAVLASFPLLAWDVIDYDYQAQMRPIPIAAIRTVSLTLFAALKVAFILYGAGAIWFALAVSGEAATSAVMFSQLARRSSRELRLSAANRPQMRRLLNDSWPLAVSGLFVIIYMRIDQVMLGQMLDDRAVGIFSAAVRLSEAWYFVPMGILAAVAPALTAAHAASERDYERKTVLFLRAVLVLSICVAALLTLLSKPIVAALYGTGYAGAAPVLALHAWAGVFVSLGVATSPWFVNAGMVRLRMMYTLGGALANVLVNLYTIPRFGAVGAAVATLLSYFLSAVALNGVSRRTRPILLLQSRAMFAWPRERYA